MELRVEYEAKCDLVSHLRNNCRQIVIIAVLFFFFLISFNYAIQGKFIT